MEPKNPTTSEGSDKVFVKVPYALIKAGFNIAGLIPKSALEQINQDLQDQGKNFDLSNMNPSNIKEIMDSLEDLTVEVETSDSIIRVYSK